MMSLYVQLTALDVVVAAAVVVAVAVLVAVAGTVAAAGTAATAVAARQYAAGAQAGAGAHPLASELKGWSASLPMSLPTCCASDIWAVTCLCVWQEISLALQTSYLHFRKLHMSVIPCSNE
jgi:phage tail sheath gpL-like